MSALPPRLAVSALLLLLLPCDAALNVLLVIVDNLRPALGAYGNDVVVTPSFDRLAGGGTVFANTHAQIAWCAPSRNSFLSGRRPQVTKAFNFVDSFREAGPAWTTLPGVFRGAGYYATSVGKVFHPNLPPNFDAALSWSDAPFCPDKVPCPNHTMTCELAASDTDVDEAATDELLARLAARPKGNFFAAIGFQAPRLPWVYPAAAAAQYPPASEIPIAVNRTSQGVSPLEWFRPSEINQYSDVHNVTHATPLPEAQQREVRRAYYATVTSVDTQLERVLAYLASSGLDASTVVVVTADHGQALGEQDLWSMMSTLDTSTRVPLVIALPRGQPPSSRLYSGPVELVDLMPTLASLAGLPLLPASWSLPGVDLSPALHGLPVAKDAAFSQITRCKNCTLAYGAEAAQCEWDARADADAFTVPCALAPRAAFDTMGLSIRTAAWRYTVWCAWDGAVLAPNLTACSERQLFDHSHDGTDGEQPLFRPEAEGVDVASDPALAHVVEQLHARIVQQFAHTV